MSLAAHSTEDSGIGVNDCESSGAGPTARGQVGDVPDASVPLALEEEAQERDEEVLVGSGMRASEDRPEDYVWFGIGENRGRKHDSRILPPVMAEIIYLDRGCCTSTS